ncbi:Potassium voltage-gated channel protein egl-36 [Bulinus truncatus]|nr:Potassium voltage-gated channel protein egl-36 [Bulinus truncatus]
MDGDIRDIEDDANSVIFRESAMHLQLRPLMSNGDAGSHVTSTLIPPHLPGSRVTFNVGGVVFQTSEATIKKVANRNFQLANPQFLKNFYDERRKEYFFDRDPEVFRSVLNYWRSGHLHLPTTMCGPQIEAELSYWGLKEVDIQPCCWNNYNTWMQTINALKKVERDRDPAYLHADEPKAQHPVSPGSRYERFKSLTWSLLTDPSFSLLAQIYAYFSLVVVILSIFSFCASTHQFFQISTDHDTNNISRQDKENLSDLLSPNATQIERAAPRSGRMAQVHRALLIIDIFCLAFFTVEYLLRLACAPQRLKFVISLIAVLDLLAIIPDYVEFIVEAVHTEEDYHHTIIDFMPFLRLMRAFRIFRLIRRVPGLWIMMYTLKASFKELSLMLVFLLVGTLLFSSVIFFVDDPSEFRSIPHGFWWAIITMTTVGYGDISPKTALGQVVGSITAVCGVLIIGFTIPSLVNSFITYFNHIEFIVQKERLQEAERKKRRDELSRVDNEVDFKETDMEFPHRRADVSRLSYLGSADVPGNNV